MPCSASFETWSTTPSIGFETSMITPWRMARTLGARLGGPLRPTRIRTGVTPHRHTGRVEAIDGRVVLSPSDLSAHLACPHLTRLELAAARGEIGRPAREDPELDVLVRRGEEHERRHLDLLRAEGRVVVENDRGGRGLDGVRA